MTAASSPRREIVAAIHAYGRARALSDYSLNNPDLDTAEVKRRIARMNAAALKVDQLIAAALGERVLTLELVRRMLNFGGGLQFYGERRYAGDGPEAAIDVIYDLDSLLALAESGAECR